MKDKTTMQANDLFLPDTVQVFDRLTGEYIGLITLRNCTPEEREQIINKQFDKEEETANPNQLSIF